MNCGNFKMDFKKAIFFGILFFCVDVNSENILFLYPNASPSHKNPAVPIMTGLAERGHQVTVVSSYKTESHPNIRDFHPFKDFEYFAQEVDLLTLRRSGVWGMIFMDYEPVFYSCHRLYKNDEFMELVRTEKFDLVLMDAFAHQCLLGLVHRLGVPYIYISALAIPGHGSLFVGARMPTSFVPYFLTRFSDRMTFPERVANMVYTLMGYYGFRRPYRGHEEIYRGYLGEDVPGIDEILRNMSMLFSNEHFSFSFPRPKLPDFVDIGAIHCRQGQALPKIFREFLDGAEDGVILFSLGSIVRPQEMPSEIRNAFVNVFSRLKQRVLWKWPEEIHGLPSNVKLSSWIPQQDVLAHPNTRLFITHAGLLSTQESIYHGVPMVDVPIFADQGFNAHRATELGIAVTLEILEITEESLETAIYTVLNNSRYTERAKQMGEYIRDQPETPKERALFWVEYVLRHNGARHLRSAARDLNFFQYYCLDVVAMVLTIVSILVFILFFVMYKLLNVVLRFFLKRVSSMKKAQ